MNEKSGICEITTKETEPTAVLKSIIKNLGENPFILMNLATIDSEYGVMNRSVLYRGMVKDAKFGENISFVTERNSRKYKNLIENPRVAITFLFQDLKNIESGIVETWQARLFDAEVVECDEDQKSELWAKERLFAKIRSHITQCGKPVDHAQLVERHDKLLKEYKSGKNHLERTKTFTVFKVLAKRWDFYKAEDDKIADRLQFRRTTFECSEKWQIIHVEP